MGTDPRFEDLYENHLDAIQRYCLRRLTRDEATDAVAETFLAAWRRIDDVPPGQELPWLYGIARNVVRNTHRSRRRQHSLRARIEAERTGVESSAETYVVLRDDQRAVLRALDALRQGDQEILRLKTWEGLSNGEIAMTLGISAHAVDMRLNRARARLAREFARRQPTASRVAGQREGRRA